MMKDQRSIEEALRKASIRDFVYSNLQKSLSELGFQQEFIDDLLTNLRKIVIKDFWKRHKEELDQFYKNKFLQQIAPAYFSAYVIPFINPCCKIIDIGCGTGVLVNQLSETGKFEQVVGIEIIPYPQWKMLSNKKTRFEIVHEDELDEFLQREHPNSVVLTWVLHHMDFDQQARYMKRVYNVLKPSSQVIILEDAYSIDLPPQVGKDLHQEFIQFSPEDRQAIIGINDWTANRVLGQQENMPIPFGYRTVEEWEKMFSEIGYENTYKNYIGFPNRDVYNPQSTMVFEKKIMKKRINVALVGIGNCASALIQGIEYYRSSSEDPVGVAQSIGDYSINDIDFLIGFDVNKNKVGSSLDKAIFVEPNCVEFLFKPTRSFGLVFKGPVLDGLDSNISQHIPVDESQKVMDIKEILTKNAIDVLVILLPAGSQKAAEYYANAAIKTGCAVINGIPADIANNHKIVEFALAEKVPLIGDDIKSQIGATIVHRTLISLFPMRNAIVDRTIQLDWGGDMDFCNLTSNNRYDTSGKRRSKTESVIDELPNKDEVEAKISASDYIPFLKNQKEAYMRIEGRVFGGKSVRIDITMQVQDAYNSAGILVDAIRAIKIAKDRKQGGVIKSAAALFNKRPPEQMPDSIAKQHFEEFIQGKRSN